MALLAVRAPRAFDGDRAVPGGLTVFVRDGLIEGVEPFGVPVPERYRLVEHPDGTLLPGLVDSHVHLVGDDSPRALEQLPELSETELTAIVERGLARQLAAGVTTVRDLGDRGWLVADRFRDRPSGPRVLASGPPITVVQGHCWNMGGEVDIGGADARDRLRAAVRDRVEHGVDVVKIMTSGGMFTPTTDVLATPFSLDELRLVADEAHAAGLAVTGHAHALTAVQQCLDAGLDGIEHCTCIAPGGYRTPPEVAERLAAQRVAVCPTLGKDPDHELEPHIQDLLDRLGITIEGRYPEIGLLLEAGVRLLAGADSGISPTKPHGVLPRAVVELTLCGAGPEQALAAATGVSADALGLGQFTGRLRRGLSADLLLVDGDPLTTIDDVTRPRTVIPRGHLPTPTTAIS